MYSESYHRKRGRRSFAFPEGVSSNDRSGFLTGLGRWQESANKVLGYCSIDSELVVHANAGRDAPRHDRTDHVAPSVKEGAARIAKTGATSTIAGAGIVRKLGALIIAIESAFDLDERDSALVASPIVHVE
jgi:hypothetical protein